MMRKQNSYLLQGSFPAMLLVGVEKTTKNFSQDFYTLEQLTESVIKRISEFLKYIFHNTK
jgi:hypothetical protein